MTDPSSCRHDGVRLYASDPIYCGPCGVFLGRAPASICVACLGDKRRDPGWETDGPLWSSVVRPHLDSLAHLTRVAPAHLETKDEQAERPPSNEQRCGPIGEEPPGLGHRLGIRSSHSSSSDHSSAPLGNHVPEPAVSPLPAGGLVAPVVISSRPLKGEKETERASDSAAPWSGAARVPCPRCGNSIRRDNLNRHLKRCAGRAGRSA